MKLFLLCLLLSLDTGSAKKPTKLSVPKYSPSFSRTSRDVGPLPGSKAGDSADTQFKRIYSHPACMRLLVRANCGSTIGKGELVTRARQLTSATGPVVQIDWETINDDKVEYWAVASATRKIVTHQMTVEDGTYTADEGKVSVQEQWEVRRLNFGPQSTTCVRLKDLNSKMMKNAVVNYLNEFSVDFFRRPSTQTSSRD